MALSATRASLLFSTVRSLANPRLGHSVSVACLRSLGSNIVIESSNLHPVRFVASPGLSLRRRFSTDDSHDDFKPKKRQPPVTSDADRARKTIEEDIAKHDVFLYMKGTPEAPNCGFSSRVVQILKVHNVRFGSRNVLEDEGIREGIKKFTDWPTIPQVFIKGNFVGGCDIVTSMHSSGELKQALADAGVKPASSS